MSVNFFGFFKNSTISSNSSFSSSTPATSSNVILFFSPAFTNLALLFPNVIFFVAPWLFPLIIINQKIKNIISNPNGVIKFNITIQTDSFSSSSVKSPVFKYSSVYDIKLSKLGILTSFSDFEFFNFTDAVLPVEEIFILSTSLLVIFVTSSEYVIFELLFSIIDDNSTITITPIINHMANVFIPFFI